jgi:hypothetical protein
MALNLREVPSSLFKYFGPERADVLLTRALKFTPLGEFNDPFEGRPNFQGFATEGTTKRLFDEHLPQILLEGYDSLPVSARNALSKEEYLGHMLPAMQAGYPELFASLETLAQHVVQGIPERLNQSMGALCLSEVPDSLLMWAHYGVSHSGFALELDAHHPYFHQQKTENDELRHIRRVLYRDSRPAGPITELDGWEVFLVKSSHWSYEREWRMFMAFSDADQIIEFPPSKTHLYKIPSEAIRGVVLGARASQQLRDTIATAISGSRDLSHLRVRSADPDQAEFVLRLHDTAI